MKIPAQIKFLKIINFDEMILDDTPIVDSMIEITSEKDDNIISSVIFDQINPELEALLPEGYEINSRTLKLDGSVVFAGEESLSIFRIYEDSKIESTTILMPLA